MTEQQFIKSKSNSWLEAAAGSGRFEKLAEQELKRRAAKKAKRESNSTLKAAA